MVPALLVQKIILKKIPLATNHKWDFLWQLPVFTLPPEGERKGKVQDC